MATESDIFELMRLTALHPSHPLRQEVEEERWAQYGRAVYKHLHDERFITAITSALVSYDNLNVEAPQHQIARKLRVFLTTGTIA